VVVDYYWHMSWMFGPLVMLFFMALCMGMLFLMMCGRHGGRSSYPLDILERALCPWRDNTSRI
jgi:hypothetical protein